MGLMLFVWGYNKRSEMKFRNPDELRITLGKITKCYPKFDDDVYHGHYYVNGEKFKFGPLSTDTLSPKKMVGKYLWMEYSIDDPDWCRLCKPAILLEDDSIPIPPSGLSRAEFEHYQSQNK